METKAIILLALLALLALVEANNSCTVSYRFKKSCKHYREPFCFEGREGCTAFRTSFNNPHCRTVHCVSNRQTFNMWSKMCYSRETFCFCCGRFVKVLTINHCQSSVCTKRVYPKVDSLCYDCLKCGAKCSEVFKFPRSWVQRFDVYINRFDVVDGRLVFFLFSESNYTI